MGVSHDNATNLGKDLCLSFFEEATNTFPGLRVERQERCCVIVMPSHPKLCWVYHFKKLDKIQIWPYFDYRDVAELHSVVSDLGLQLHPRNKYSGMAQWYPLPIELSSVEDIRVAIPVLQFAQSRIKRSGSLKRDAFQLLPDELVEPQFFPEGEMKSITVNTYERSNRARNACIKHFGLACSVCQFDFEKQYGALGKGFIQVHDIVEISKIGRNYKVDPKKDLRPVCPNCHSMLHTKNPAMSIDDLKALLVPG